MLMRVDRVCSRGLFVGFARVCRCIWSWFAVERRLAEPDQRGFLVSGTGSTWTLPMTGRKVGRPFRTCQQGTMLGVG